MHGWILDLFFELVLINRFQRQMHPVVASGD
jgi:hypothetical protein